MKISTTFIAVALLTCAMLAGPASATNNSAWQENGNAIAQCSGALPTYEGLLRKRPLAITNEGNTTAFLNCGLNTLAVSGGKKVHAFGVVLENLNTTPVTVRCTGVIGQGNPSTAEYIVKTATLAGGARQSLLWTQTSDNGNQPWRANVTVQCALGRLVGVNELVQVFTP